MRYEKARKKILILGAKLVKAIPHIPSQGWYLSQLREIEFLDPKCLSEVKLLWSRRAGDGGDGGAGCSPVGRRGREGSLRLGRGLVDCFHFTALPHLFSLFLCVPGFWGVAVTCYFPEDYGRGSREAVCVLLLTWAAAKGRGVPSNKPQSTGFWGINHKF